MSYSSKKGKRPSEYASKASHGYIIRDAVVQEFLKNCSLPKKADEIEFDLDQQHKFSPPSTNPVRYVIAIDGGYTEVVVRAEFPSATLCFYQLGALIFSVEDLENLDLKAFIDPEDMAKLNQIQRLKFVIPVRNIALDETTSLTQSVRESVYKFFCQSIDDDYLIDTLSWFIFGTYSTTSNKTWNLATCPECNKSNVPLHYLSMQNDYTFRCDVCKGTIYLTDTFRLHEVIDDELGAGGILGYVMTTVEQIVLVHLIRLILKTKPALLSQILFIKDGPLAFFGQTANMHKPMRALIRYLQSIGSFFLAGLEKSGAFVEHADEIADSLEASTVQILDNNYIYKYILAGQPDPARPYGSTTYYSNKVIFKTPDEQMYVISLPTKDILASPQKSDFADIDVILENIRKLKCDMYDNALIPIALANKLVSLAEHPSSKILQKFAIGTLRK